MTKFSIIIPHRGSETLLNRCVASIPKRDDVETIVIIDEEGRGAGWARNKGLVQAIGDYIIFADSDDFFHPCFNELLYKLKDETADVVYFNADSIVLGSGEPSWRANHLNRIMRSTDTAWRERHLRYYFTEPWCKAIRLSLIKEHNIQFSETRILNDIYFSTQVGIYAKEIKAYTEKCYCVRNHAGSTAKLSSDDRKLEATRETARANMLLRQYGVHHHHSRMLRPMASAILHGKLSLARQCWKEMRDMGYSNLKLMYYTFRYPYDVMKLIVRKTQSGEWNKK